MRESHKQEGLHSDHVSFTHLGASALLVLGVSVTLFLVGVIFKLLEWRSSGTEKTEHVELERILYFDLWRVLCVALVVLSHSWEGYHEQNFFGVCQWVLQYVTIISAICFARSSTGLGRYCLRLLMFCGLGTMLNWMALFAIADEAIEDPLRVSFQMAYILCLVFGAIGVSPMKWLLKEKKDLNYQVRVEMRHGLAFLPYFMALVLLMPLVFHSSWLEQKSLQVSLLRVPWELMESMLLPCSAVVAHFFLRDSETKAWIGWVWLALLQAGRILNAEPRPGSEIHLLDLYIWSGFIYFVPLAYQAKIGKAIAQLWLLWAVPVALLVGLPGAEPPFPAQYPSPEVMKRARFYFVESVFILAFVTIPSAGKQHTLVIPQSAGPTLDCLNYLSLAAFCSHKAIIDVVQHTWR